MLLKRHKYLIMLKENAAKKKINKMILVYFNRKRFKKALKKLVKTKLKLTEKKQLDPL